MNKLSTLIDQLEQYIAKQSSINPSVSRSSAGWHIEHSLLTIDSIVEALRKSEPASYKGKFSFPRLLISTINRIPRGRAQAPSTVQPNENFSTESLKTHVASTRQKLLELDKLQSNNFIKHPVFGSLKLKPTMKFIAIHTQHHLIIIKDILKN
jgi:hypothetical protein